MNIRNIWSATLLLLAIPFSFTACAAEDSKEAAKSSAKPNILVVWGDDIGQSNICLLYTSDAADDWLVVLV